MAVNSETNQSTVRISSTGTEAYLSVYPPTQDEKYTEGDLLDILKGYGVVHGIKTDVLREIINSEQYFKEYLVSEGVAPQNGQDGKYEFFFNTHLDRKPKILPDGSVDYGSVNDVEMVEAGTEIVHYIPAVKGTDGISVTGNILTAKHGKELPVIKGKGFSVSEDKLVYTALISGKVEYTEGKLRVSDVLVIEGDVSVTTGDVDFAGDVIIHGNIAPKMTVSAKGSITVDGHVEGAKLIAKKDIVLKNGMQGTGNGEIRAGGNVSGKFFEHTTIFAKGVVNSNALLNCNIMAEEGVIAAGKLGIIVGGNVNSVRYVEASTIGNLSEVRTNISLGVDAEVYNHLNSVRHKIAKITEDISKIEAGVAQITRILEKGDNQELGQKKLQLVRAKIERDTQLSNVRQEMEDINERIRLSANARLVVHKSIYRGTKLSINGDIKMIESENYNVTYQKKGAEIEFYPNI